MLLQDLGFVNNGKKSVLTPSQRILFLGFMVDSLGSSLNLPSRKLAKIWQELKRTLACPLSSLCQIARVVSPLSASLQAISPGPLHYRALQRLKAQHLRRGISYSQKVPLSDEARDEIGLWLSHMEAWNGWVIFNQKPDVVIVRRQPAGQRACCASFSTGDTWSSEEKRLHINCLELLAGSFAIQC